MLESPIRPAMRSPLQQALDRIGSAPAVWTPATLFAASEQGVWYDPSDFSTLFQDSAGATPVTATGQVVGKMLDKSGRGNHATQATTASKPILQQDGNGKYYLAFDGVDDRMESAAVNFTATDEMTSFFGVLNSQPSSLGFILSVGESGADGRLDMYATSSGEIRTELISGGIVNDKYSSLSTATAYVLTDSMNISGATLNDRIFRRVNASGASQLGSGPALTGAFGAQVVRIGALAASFPFAGRIYQLIIRGALTDAAGITAAETFVNSKTAAY